MSFESRSAPLNLALPFPGTDWRIRRADKGIVCWDASPMARDGAVLLDALIEDPDAVRSLPLLSNIGSKATVYRVGDLVVKSYDKLRSYKKDAISGGAYLQASVALHQGLETLDQPYDCEYWRGEDGTTFLYGAPRMYGSFVPDAPSKLLSPIAVMSMEAGEMAEGSQLSQPSRRVRQAVCSLAMRAAGIPGERVYVDRNPENVLLGQLGEATVKVVQLDVMATRNGIYPVRPV